MWDSMLSHNDISEPMYKTWEHDGYGETTTTVYSQISLVSLLLEGIHTPVANALITDEHSTITGK